MDRVDQAVALLKESKSKGLSFYDAKQVLVQNGFTDSEIGSAADNYDYESGNPTSLQSVNVKDDIHEIELQQAKVQLSRDYWYSFIPVVGAFYKAKRINDYTKYESLKTGRDPLLVLAIWLIVMAVAAIFALVVGPGLVGLLTKSNTALYLSHYLGVIVAVLLLYFIFRKRKR